MTIPSHILPSSGDPMVDLRRDERIAWHNYLRVAGTLAKSPLTQASQYRQREQGAKQAWADALRALDKALS